ncbi:DNA repair protein RecO [Bacillus horti]|uniref:DNA repair protein RecO n=1 Tax=Caldalkalibacillus horti TaxID=77523 RepID=A0ABT9W491_9BACI|nr:DNA repair protein RecO [Bacillus horti]MDQ0168057.1 DNA repair protein RecO (recombination protein O) [Bacillus horti]
MLIRAEGIVIRSNDYGEGNKILTLYTKEHGKIGVMARGAKKTKSRLSSVAQLFTYGNFLFYKGAGRGMGSLSQGEPLESFRELRQDLLKTSYAAYFAELTDKIVEENEPNAYLFRLLVDSFRLLDEDKDAEIVSRLFELKILSSGGYRPSLNGCVVCGRTEGYFGFSVQEGGFICERCYHVDPQKLSLQPGTVKILRTLYLIEPYRLGNINVKPETRAELKKVLWFFMDHHTPLRLKSRDFLEKMTKLF